MLRTEVHPDRALVQPFPAEPGEWALIHPRMATAEKSVLRLGRSVPMRAGEPAGSAVLEAAAAEVPAAVSAPHPEEAAAAAAVTEVGHCLEEPAMESLSDSRPDPVH